MPSGGAAAIEERIAAWTLLPVHNGEGLQVLRYGPGQRYDAHWVSQIRHAHARLTSSSLETPYEPS